MGDNNAWKIPSDFCCHISPVTSFSPTLSCSSPVTIVFPYFHAGFLGGLDGKESAYNLGDAGLIPGFGRSSGGRHGNPLRYSCLENPMYSLMGCSPGDCKESDRTEQLTHTDISLLDPNAWYSIWNFVIFFSLSFLNLSLLFYLHGNLNILLSLWFTFKKIKKNFKKTFKKICMLSPHFNYWLLIILKILVYKSHFWECFSDSLREGKVSFINS